ncbi:MAG TPA: flavin reductase [Sumerlaeia bacterium]|nr:flavin reductase [Sumerlaeia bacterium]
MRELGFADKAAEAMVRLANGAFLTVRAGDAVNVMTIGWAQIGVIWGKEVLTVMVRDSRYTFGLMEKASDFAVTIPWEDKSKELGYCGSHSGRDVDKFAQCGLEAVAGREIQSPTIRCKGLHYDCRILFKSRTDPKFLDAGVAKFYPKGDYHTFFFGEIVACYET